MELREALHGINIFDNNGVFVCISVLYNMPRKIEYSHKLSC